MFCFARRERWGSLRRYELTNGCQSSERRGEILGYQHWCFLRRHAHTDKKLKKNSKEKFVTSVIFWVAFVCLWQWHPLKYDCVTWTKPQLGTGRWGLGRTSERTQVPAPEPTQGWPISSEMGDTDKRIQRLGASLAHTEDKKKNSCLRQGGNWGPASKVVLRVHTSAVVHAYCTNIHKTFMHTSHTHTMHTRTHTSHTHRERECKALAVKS